MDSHSPIEIQGPEQSQVDLARSDAGLMPAVGVQSYQVFRASQVLKPDHRGYTYHHHIDLACWKGKLYVGWNSCEKDEDVWPSRELLSTSDDGITWTEPADMFPQGVSTPLRMYFFIAKSTGRLLLIAGLRTDHENTEEDTKGGLVVREIFADHKLGEVFTLRKVGPVEKIPPMFETSPDAGFVQSCRESTLR